MKKEQSKLISNQKPTANITFFNRRERADLAQYHLTQSVYRSISSRFANEIFLIE